MRIIPFIFRKNTEGVVGPSGNINQAQMDVLGNQAGNLSAQGAGETVANQGRMYSGYGANMNMGAYNPTDAGMGASMVGGQPTQFGTPSQATQTLTSPMEAPATKDQQETDNNLKQMAQRVDNFNSTGTSGTTTTTASYNPSGSSTSNQVTNTSTKTTPTTPTTTAIKSESYLRYIPSIKVINKMTREELKVLKKYLQNFVLKEAESKHDINDIGIFTKAFVGNWQSLPMLLQKFYPNFISDDINTTYNSILDYADIKDSTIDTLTNLKSTVKNSLDSTMSLINQSSDWISIILSKNLSDLGLDSSLQLGSLTIGKFLAVTSLCASIVYIMVKLFKSGFKSLTTYSECEQYFNKLYTKHLVNYKEGVEEKLKEYMKKDVPTNILTLHSIITKCVPLAGTLLFSGGYDESNMSTLPSNILILATLCSAMVIFYDNLLGKKFKSMVKNGETISNNLKMKMDVNSSKDIFGKLNNFKDSFQ